MKYALVTGGSRGIGRAICLDLAEKGYHVLINYQSNVVEAQKTLELVQEKGSDGELMQFDVVNKKEVLEKLQAWKENHKDDYIEVLINNAGIRKDNLLLWMMDEEWDSVTDITIKGFYNVTQALLKDMLVAKFGRIINIVSLSGIKGMPGQTNYSAAKAGVIGLTKSLAREFASKGVTVNAVSPGFIDTKMTSVLSDDIKNQVLNEIPLKKFGDTTDIAKAVLFLASNDAKYITGQTLSVDGGLSI